MILKNKKWNLTYELNVARPLYIYIRDTIDIYTFLQDYTDSLEDNGNEVVQLYKDSPLKLENVSDYISNLIALDLNTRKSINFLHKLIVSEVVNNDSVFEFEEIKNKLVDWFHTIKENTLIDFSINENVDLPSILKLFSIKFSQRKNTLFELLIKYLELLLDISKIKVLFINFAFYLFSKEEILELIQFCKNHNLYIIFIEKEKKCYNELDIDVISIIDNELF